MATVAHYWQIEKSLRAKFRGAYLRGWNHSADSDNPHRSLDNNPDSGILYWAWEDGYLDYAADREFGHRLTEHDHDACP